jgi:serine/threonine protein kinase
LTHFLHRTQVAKEINTQEQVVVKQFQSARPGASWREYDSYEKEITILKRINHPQIPRYRDAFATPTGFCMIQEYKNAYSLADVSDYQPEEVKQIALGILDILCFLQNQIPPIIHRDLKPENILIDESLQVSLVDFGFARLGSAELAVSSVVKGTLGFMPPEQIFNRQLSPASDLYSLGMTLIALLTKTHSTEISKLIDNEGKVKFKDQVTHLHPDFIYWLEKMVEPQSKNRFPNAQVALNK